MVTAGGAEPVADVVALRGPVGRQVVQRADEAVAGGRGGLVLGVGQAHQVGVGGFVVDEYLCTRSSTDEYVRISDQHQSSCWLAFNALPYRRNFYNR